MNLYQEAYSLVSSAGQKLSKDYEANEHVKTVAGFILKCMGHHEIHPSGKTITKAKEMITAHQKGNLYTEDEILLADACINYKKFRNIKLGA